MSTGLVYLILGTPNADQQSVVLQLIEQTSANLESPTLYTPQVNGTEIQEKKLKTNCQLASYDEWSQINPDSDTQTLFIIAKGNVSPQTQIEAFQTWLKSHPYQLARIITVINCQFASQHNKLRKWIDCCVHFSDCVLLNNRHGVSPKWIKEFLKYYEQECYPCVFELVKKNARVDSPNNIINPEARRISTIFDDLDAIDLLEIDEENLPDEVIDLEIPEDPYLEKNQDGKYCINLPDINDFL